MRLLRINDACATTGDKRSTYYTKVKERLITKPVPIGGRTVAWPDTELEAINRARVAGKSDDEIRELVAELEARRKTAARHGIEASPPLLPA